MLLEVRFYLLDHLVIVNQADLERDPPLLERCYSFYEVVDARSWMLVLFFCYQGESALNGQGSNMTSF